MLWKAYNSTFHHQSPRCQVVEDVVSVARLVPYFLLGEDVPVARPLALSLSNWRRCIRGCFFGALSFHMQKFYLWPELLRPYFPLAEDVSAARSSTPPHISLAEDVPVRALLGIEFKALPRLHCCTDWRGMYVYFRRHLYCKLAEQFSAPFCKDGQTSSPF